ncbi:hypothetical protein [Aureimonas sp. N4]|uniref:hypothetical protein n=1 Tax=Aureimonas sp. N4 TaxID=1638165 RepID=UPI000782D817|nr:hypothetical protein [Aureimonas sp. N4]
METGDILYFPNGPFHHIGMAYDARTVIHANHKKNFHKTSDQYETGSQSFYMSEGAGVEHFRPPGQVFECRRAQGGVAASGRRDRGGR